MIIYLREVIYGRQKNLSQFQYNFKFYLKLATRLAGLKHRITHLINFWAIISFFIPLSTCRSEPS